MLLAAMDEMSPQSLTNRAHWPTFAMASMIDKTDEICPAVESEGVERRRRSVDDNGVENEGEGSTERPPPTVERVKTLL